MSYLAQLTFLLVALLALVWVALALQRYFQFVRERKKIGNELRLFARSLPVRPNSSQGGEIDSAAPADSARGIVLCAGGRGLLSQAYSNLDAIRRLHGCQLPVELFYSGSAEISESSRSLFESEFAPLRCIDARALPAPAGHTHSPAPAGFPLKAFALLASEFDEVLMLDADSVPVQPPEPLFDSPEYRQTGNLFWPDSALLSVLVHHPRRFGDLSLRDFGTASAVQTVNPRIYDYVDLPRPATLDRIDYETEAGQILIDRHRVRNALDMAWAVNARASFFDRYLYGDKDTYRIAFGLSNLPFNQLRRVPDHLGEISDGIFRGRAFLQYGPDGQPFFLHQTHRKPHVDMDWAPLTHLTRDPAVDHPRPRKARDVTLLARVDDLNSLESLPESVDRLESFLCESHQRLRERADEIGLPPPKVSRNRRRILPF